MKFLHTADWHVGKTLRGRSRAEEHRAVLGEIADIATREAVDVVLVAGDLFDSAAPTAEAEEIVYRALMELAATGAEVVVVAGNHDSPPRLAAVRSLLDLARVRVAAYPTRPAEGGIVEVSGRGGGQARIALLPFLSQRGIVKAEDLMARDAEQHTLLYADRCRNILAALCRDFDPRQINIVVAHLTVVGGMVGGGERLAQTVFDYHVPTQVFPASAHYVALGHLHRAQQLPAGCPVWYSGAPLFLDFGDSAEERCVLVVTAAPGLPAQVQRMPLHSGRRLRTLKGTLAELSGQAETVGDDFLRIVLSEQRRPGLAEEVRERFPNAVDVAIQQEGEGQRRRDAFTLSSLQRSPTELFGEYLQEEAIAGEELAELFGTLLEEAATAEEAPA